MTNEKIICRMKSGAVHGTIWGVLSDDRRDVSFRVTWIRSPEYPLDAWWNPFQFGAEDLPDMWKLAHEALTTIHQFEPKQIQALLEGREIEH